MTLLPSHQEILLIPCCAGLRTHLWSKECSENDNLWLPRLDLEKLCSFSLDPYFGRSQRLNPLRSQAGAPANSPASWTASRQASTAWVTADPSPAEPRMTAAHTSMTSTKQDFSENCSAERFWIPYHKMVSILKWLFHTNRFWVICSTAMILEQRDGGWGAVRCSRVSEKQKTETWKSQLVIQQRQPKLYQKCLFIHMCTYICIYLIWNRIDIADIELLTQTFSLKWLQWTWTKMQKL